MPATPPIARLLISCPDGPGIVAAVSAFLFERGANIVTSDQHSSDPAGGRFFMRMTFTLDAGAEGWAELERDFSATVGEPRAMEWRLAKVTGPRRIALLASREDHCLLDLLWRASRGELPAEVAVVVSNHETAREAVAGFGVPYVHVPVTADTKPGAEAAVLEALAASGCDTVVLARYMQILSPGFLAAVGVPVINIHHSFLPAFAGADPYRRALERGVKIIGATAHYVTEELDGGPIIEQDVVRVSHRADVAELTRMGADIERLVLARAVRWHLEDRVLVDGNKTVVF
ncbi:MAG TPA: formyltetrahydrofolate deformylase [Solirubrobacteraceae bacterium]|nr:formyltetrahydrofolate deformylase [Solirubrobacteraceae bacterium]